jgi:hypothetical protein
MRRSWLFELKVRFAFCAARGMNAPEKISAQHRYLGSSNLISGSTGRRADCTGKLLRDYVSIEVYRHRLPSNIKYNKERSVHGERSIETFLTSYKLAIREEISINFQVQN